MNAERRADALKTADDAATERVTALEAETRATTAQLHKEMDEADKLRRLMEVALPQSKARKLNEQVARLEGEVASAKNARDKYKAMANIASKQAATIRTTPQPRIFITLNSGTLRSVIYNRDRVTYRLHILPR